ncbi:putative RING-H2 finger protein ATL21A [Salvia splendens]|uniref:putative RING-H2 finger protein ATL21A n=1 Tax=Salvia splendens TaxID=180675 RepID=UPI001C254FD3|nr:putative RING-H2 finger protein ATL21A [Salvia splendens]
MTNAFLEENKKHIEIDRCLMCDYLMKQHISSSILGKYKTNSITFLMMVVFLCVACLSHTMDCYTGEIDSETGRRRIMDEFGTPSTTLNAAPAAANATHLDDTQIKSCSVLIDVEANGSGVQVQSEKNGCSICLEEYCANDKFALSRMHYSAAIFCSLITQKIVPDFGTMDLTIKHTFLIILIISPVIIHSKGSCLNSSCGSSLFPIKYPFKLETDDPPINCHNSINLRCDDDGRTVIYLPRFGDFYVTDINYNLRIIALTYAKNCLPRMLMTNFSVSPLATFSVENYTFFVCDKNRFTRRYEIRCLSNSTKATVAMTRDSSGHVEGLGCRPIVSSMIPVPLLNEDNDWQNLDHLELTWNLPSCQQHCELLYGQDKQGETKSRLAKLITGSSVFIPLAVILTTFFSIACIIRLLKLIAGGATTTTVARNIPEGSTATTVAPPPPATAGGPTSAEASKVESFSQVMVLDEGNQDTALMCCSICLEEYHGKDRVRSLGQCGHLFHAECIDQWLLKSNSCPICRTPLSVL